MLSFKTFLLLEDIGQDSEAFGDVLHPSQAGDYMYAVSDPTEFAWLKWRWKNEKKIGRKFYGIDTKAVQKVPFVSLQSTEMPDGSDKAWKHGRDRNSTQEIHKSSQLFIKGHGESSKRDLFSQNLAYYSINGNLERYFKDNHSGKWPEQAPDTDWTK